MCCDMLYVQCVIISCHIPVSQDVTVCCIMSQQIVVCQIRLLLLYVTVCCCMSEYVAVCHGMFFLGYNMLL